MCTGLVMKGPTYYLDLKIYKKACLIANNQGNMINGVRPS